MPRPHPTLRRRSRLRSRSPRLILTAAVAGIVVSGGLLVAPAAQAAPAAASSEFTFSGQDDFTGPALDGAKWEAMTGNPACCPDTTWSSARVSQSDGVLHLTDAPDSSGHWLGGAVASDWAPGRQLYGRYEARFKANAGEGSQLVGLLYPETGWPPEVDFLEFERTKAARQEAMLTTHWLGGGQHQLSQAWVHKDFTQWHTVTVEWTPSRLDYFMDGALVKSERDTARIPHQKMWLGFQTEAIRDDSGRLPTAASGLDVDYVKFWSYHG